MKTHPLNVTHLVMGVLLLGIAGIWGAHQLDWLDSSNDQYVAPVLLIAAGSLGLLAFTLRGVLGRRKETDS